jgi:hypothetical protein
MLLRGLSAIWYALFSFVLPLVIAVVALLIFAAATVLITKTNGMQALELVDLLQRLLSGKDIAPEKEQVVFRVLQSAVLFISLLLLAKPIIAEVYKTLTDQAQALISVNYGPWWRRHFDKGFDLGRHATAVLLPMYRKAEEVIIVAGDYSWLDGNEDKRNSVKSTLLALHKAQKLCLYSYKDARMVGDRLASTVDAEFQELVRSIRHSPHFKVKASFIKHHSYRQFIYLDTDQSKRDFLCTINEGDETRKALDFVGEAFRQLDAPQAVTRLATAS